MATRASDIPYRQDRAPIGGYSSIKWARDIPRRGPPGAVLLAGVLAVCALGTTDIIFYNRQKREWRKDKHRSRLYLLPLLQAEEDRRVLKSMMERQAEEALIMKDVRGWVVGECLYNTNQWMAPNYHQMKEGDNSY